MQDLEKILAKFEEIVSPNFCTELGRRSGFIQRSTSQIKGFEFAQAMMVPNAFLEAETLNSLAVRMKKINKTCNLSAPALAQRINSKGAEEFMKACFGKALKELIKKDLQGVTDLGDLSGFNRILLEDNTRAELHEKLSPYFKGSGGVASKASVKINYVFDYLSEEIVDIDFFSGNKPDQNLASRIVQILEKDDLIIRDLGYFVLKTFKEIEEKEGYYVSRWKVNEDVYESKEAKNPLDLAKFLDKHIWKGIADVEVFVGKERHLVRLVACLMSEEAVNKRRREANRTAKKRGTKVSKKKTNLLKYCIFITNIPPMMLSNTAVMAIYRARWKVELIFKQWKSCLKVHLFKGYNKERFYCFLYGRLIMILLLGCMSPPLLSYAQGLGRELSCYKLTNYLIADHTFARALQEGRIEQFLKELQEDIPRRLCMDKRKRLSLRTNMREGKSHFNELAFRSLYENVA